MKHLPILLALLLGGLYGCSPRVTVNKNDSVDFSQYRTYAWMDSDLKADDVPPSFSQIATDNVENSISEVLANKGLRKAETNPDLLVGYHFFTDNETRTVAAPASPVYGPYRGWGRWGYGGWAPGYWGYGGRQYVQREYTSGTVVVDMVDASTKKLIWQGSIEDAVTNPAQIGTKLVEQVERITKKFPEGKS